MTTIEENPLVSYARTELELAGLFDEDSDYNGAIGTAVLAIVETFAGQGHSGFSAEMVTEIVSRLMRYQPLTPLTDDPGEWTQVAGADASDPEAMWQSRRNPAAFSKDGGKTYTELGAIDMPWPTEHKE